MDTAWGPLCLRRRELLGRPGVVVTEVTIDSHMLMSSLHTASEEAMSSRGVAWHGGERLSVLVGGLGLGYTANAALATGKVDRVRVVELEPAVIRWLKDGLVPLSLLLANDPRLEVVQRDVYGLLLGPAREAWDLVLVDVDHSPDEPLDPASAPFYTPHGLRRVATHLRPGGVLGVWSAGDDDPAFQAALREVFAEVMVERVEWVNELIDEGREMEDVIFFARGPR